jgi:hypothetical protein
MPTLNLNLGEGLCIDNENKLSVKYTGNYIHITPNGLFVDPLTGAAGSITDSWSTKQYPGTAIDYNVISPRSTSNFIDVDREVTNLIYSYGVYTVGTRGLTNIAYTNQVRTISDLVYEMNYPVTVYGGNSFFYLPRTGELIQLVDKPETVGVNTNSTEMQKTAAETGRRGNNLDMETKVLFMVSDVLLDSDVDPGASGRIVAKLKLLCLYSSVPEYVVGNEYSHGY